MKGPVGSCAGLHYHGSWHGSFDPSHGGAVPLLVLPGLLGDGQNLRRLRRDLGAGKPGRPVLCIDPLGGGQSEAPADPSAYCWADQTARLMAVLDHLGLAEVDVLGLSMGGMWAQHALLSHPGRFRSAVLAATSCRTEPRMRCIVQALLAQLQAGLAPLDLARSLLVLLFSPAFLDRPGAVPLCEALMTMTTSGERPLSRHGLGGQLDAILAHDLGERLRGLPHVTRLIAGEMDWLTTPPVHERLLAALAAPPDRLLVLPGAGHCLWVEQPACFAQAVLDGLPPP